MAFFEELLDDVSILLKSLDKAGVKLLEKQAPLVLSSDPRIESEDSRKARPENPCQGCGLFQMGLPKTKGIGSGNSRIVFVSSWPEAGSPISGESGELLNRIIKAMNIEPENTYITNIIKCQPPPGLIPTVSDVSSCINYLQKEINALKPVAIILLGEFASKNFLGDKSSFNSIEGKFHEWQGVRVMPTYHPDDLLRDASKKRNVWDAMKKVMALISSGGEL